MNTNKYQVKMSQKVISRISFYYEALLKLELPPDSYISSKQLETITGVSCNQVRQDFFYLGISIGKQKKGYHVAKLYKALKKVLSVDQGALVIVIGAGRLGRALSEYKLFKERNIQVTAFFDIKEELIGTTANIKGRETPILHIDRIGEYLSQNPRVKIALLAIPENNAQEILDELVNLGIKGIVNYSPKILKLPRKLKSVQLVNDCIGASLYKVVYQVYHKK
ncbi:MAG: redox-sensing transcriptional repressor Rex [Candidatus Aminicenantes bacterium]|nr:redox-sensing transcriptional repressor Rex [Candidatus Aminicenantes bacterium]